MKRTRTDIYEDKTFFGDYLESTSEKDIFVHRFADRVRGEAVHSLLDLGCFDGSLTRNMVSSLLQKGHPLQRVVAVEPAEAPLLELKKSVFQEGQQPNWECVHSSMEAYLSRTTDLFDWVIVSHSLYWMGDSNEILKSILNAAKSGAIIIRDTGLLYEVEVKYRPMMTNKKKRFISSKEICDGLKEIGAKFEVESFASSMGVPDQNSDGFKALAGFLLDLTMGEIKEDLLKNLYDDLDVKNGRSSYGIDIIWLGGAVCT